MRVIPFWGPENGPNIFTTFRFLVRRLSHNRRSANAFLSVKLKLKCTRFRIRVGGARFAVCSGRMATPPWDALSARAGVEVNPVSYELRRATQAEWVQRKRARLAQRRREDLAFSLFCSHCWEDPSLRLCMEKIASPSPGLEAEALLRRLQDRYLETRIDEIADVARGCGGGIADSVHRSAAKLWQEMSVLSWIREQNYRHGVAPLITQVYDKLAEPLAAASEDGFDEMETGTSHAVKKVKIWRFKKKHGLRVGVLYHFQTRCPQENALTKARPLDAYETLLAPSKRF